MFALAKCQLPVDCVDQYIELATLTLFWWSLSWRRKAGDAPSNQYVVISPLPCETTQYDELSDNHELREHAHRPTPIMFTH